MKFKSLYLLPIILILSFQANAQYQTGRAEVQLIVNNEIYPYEEFALYVLPAEHLGLCIIALDADEYVITAEAGDIDRIEDCRWIWTAPDDPGMYTLRVISGGSNVAMTMNIFVMIPGSELVNGHIRGVNIGDYPQPLENSPIYLPPDGFIEVTEDLLDTPVSPNFRLGQFVSPLDGQFPKYIVLRERLLLKLESLLEHLNELDIEAESLSIISAYLTPSYNRQLGGQSHSRHIYGGAATIIVDADDNGIMDDIDGDGELTTRDGIELFDITDELFSRPGREYLKGGLFLYEEVASRGSVLLLDARGFRKRWENSSDLPEIPENLRAKHKRQFE